MKNAWMSVALSACVMLAPSVGVGASCVLLTDAEGGSGDWTASTRWKDGAVPQSGDDINIKASVTVTDAEMPVLMRAKYVVTRGAAATLTLDLSEDYVVTSALTGDGVIRSEGSGKLTLTSAECAPSGGFVFAGGTVVLPRDSSNMKRIVVDGARVEMTSGGNSKYPLPPIEIRDPGVVCLPASGDLTLRGLSGDGALVAHAEADATKAQQLILVGNGGEVFEFSGTIPANLAWTLNGGNQHLLRPTNESRKDFRLQCGVMGVASFGAGTEAGSFGTSDVWWQGVDDATLLYLGTEGETTSRAFRFTSNPKGELTLDGGAHGGVTFAGPFSCDSTGSDFMMRLALAGSNAAPCVIQGNFNEPSEAAVCVTKRGTGCWRFPAKAAKFKGCFAIVAGTLEYASLAEAGTACSLGFATRLHEPYSGTRDDTKAVPYAYLLGNGETDVSPALATFAYVGDTDATALTRPLALRGAGRLRNASDGKRLTLRGVTAVQAGVNRLCLDGGDGTVCCLSDVTNGVGTIAVVKEGAGTWELGGRLEVEGGVSVRAGTLKLSFSEAGGALGTVSAATDATLDVTSGTPVATGLSVGAGLAGTYRGVAFAPTGTLLVDVPPDAGRAFMVPCAFENCTGVENLKDWTLTVSGRRGRWRLVKADANGLSFAKPGIAVILR